MAGPLELDLEAIAVLCRRYGVSRLAAFGSAMTDRFDPECSDVDFLVQFREETAPTFRTYFDLKTALEELLGRPVDLVMPKALQNPYFAESVAQTSRELYAA